MNKRYIPPIIVTSLLIIYMAVYFIFIASLLPHLWLKVFFTIIPVIFSMVLIYVLLQRIKEIKGGAESDLGKY